MAWGEENQHMQCLRNHSCTPNGDSQTVVIHYAYL